MCQAEAVPGLSRTYSVGIGLTLPLFFLVLFGAQIGMLVLDTFTFLLAARLTPQVNSFALAPYVVGYSVVYGLIMRFIRLAAYLQEWIFRSSYRDSYVPMKVHITRK